METKEPQVTPEQSGYECEFIESPQEAFKTHCPICLNILRDPYEVNCCGKNFCHACLKNVQANSKPCPACNHEGFSAHPNLGLRQSLTQLPVRCSHHKDGCEWIGELGELDKHLNLNPEPDKRLDGCKYAEIPCVHCANLFERHLIPNHESECPLQPVKCDFHFAGCNVRLQCGDMPAHLAECAAEHLSFVAKRLEGDGRQIAELETKLAKAVQEKNVLEMAKKLFKEEVDELKKDTKVSIQKVDRQVDARTRDIDELKRQQELRGQQQEQDINELKRHQERDINELKGQQDRDINELKGQLDQRGQQVEKQEQDIDEVKRQQEQRRQQVDEQEQVINELKQKLDQRGQHNSWWIIVAIVVAIAALVMSSGRNYSSIQQEIADLGALSSVNHSVLQQEIADLGALSSVNHSVLHQEFSQHVTKLETKHKEMETSFNSQLREVTSEQEQISKLVHTTIVPVIITMADFSQHKRDNDDWYSDPFYTHPHGYKMCLRVDANGSGSGKGTHVSVYVYLMRGEFDDYLKWPFRGEITIQLLNQLADKEHHSQTISFTDETPDTIAGRATTGERGEKESGEKSKGWGYRKFIFSKKLKYSRSKNCQYLKDDRFQFRVTKQGQFLLRQEFSQHVTKLETKHNEMEISFSSQLREVTSEQKQISKLVHTPIVPVIITMTDFEKHKRCDDSWFSDPFYTHPHGYKMCLRVYANGVGKSEGTHVSVGVYLMRGEFDDHLKWPFRGDITIQLLKQLEDKDHHTMTISFNDKTPDFAAGRVTTGERGGFGRGHPTFISHKELDKANGAKYLEKDCLQFHIKQCKVVL